MSLSNYAGLVASVETWMDNAEAEMVAAIPDFIALTEARLNRLLRDPNSEARATTTMAGQYTALPSDMSQLLSVSTGDNKLRQVSLGEIEQFDQTVTGEPRFYALSGGAITFAPIDTTATVTITYVKGIPALSATNTTNWLLTLAPDVYLYGCLLQAEIFGWNDERLPIIKAGWDEAIDELVKDAENRKWGAAPIGPRLGRT